MKKEIFLINLLLLLVFKMHASEKQMLGLESVTQEQGVPFIDVLPEEVVINEILPKLDDRSLLHLAQSSKKHAALCKEELGKRKKIRTHIRKLSEDSLRKLINFSEQELISFLMKDETLKPLDPLPEQLKKYAQIELDLRIELDRRMRESSEVWTIRITNLTGHPIKFQDLGFLGKSGQDSVTQYGTEKLMVRGNRENYYFLIQTKNGYYYWSGIPLTDFATIELQAVEDPKQSKFPFRRKKLYGIRLLLKEHGKSTSKDIGVVYPQKDAGVFFR